jgi:uncharacterized membrane protein
VFIFGFVLLFQSYLSEAGARRARSRESYVEVSMVVALFVAWLLLIETFFFLTWNPVGTTLIDGLQGRYFLPVAILPLIAIRLRREPAVLPRRQWPYIAGSSALLTWCVVAVFNHFY